MLTSSRSYFLLICLIILFLMVSLAAFAYIFFIASWEPTSKVAAVLMYLLACSFMAHWLQINNNRKLAFQLKATGKGSKDIFSDLYQNSPVPYFRTDKSGRILHGNAAAVRLFHMTVEELSGQSLYTFITDAPQEGVARVLSLEGRISAAQFINEAEVMFTTKDSEGRWGLLSVFPYEHNTERLVTLIDITEQKAMDIAKSEFVSLASHQLRTPISAMLWNLELLTALLGNASEQQREYLEKIRRSGEKMNALVSDFLDATKLEMGTFATKPAEVALNDFLTHILEEFEPSVVTKALTVHANYLPTETSLVTDPALLHMIVSNLVSNAIKYTPAQGQVMVSIVAIRGGVQFRVQDTGIGVPTTDQPKLFSKLYRASNTKTSPTEGTGLGLYVVKQAIEHLGGTIAFASKEGVGTEFVVTLPYTA